MCKLCKKAHWGVCNFDELKTAVKTIVNKSAISPPEMVINKKLTKKKVKPVKSDASAEKTSRHGKYKDKNKRREYMKNYMKKKRGK